MAVHTITNNTGQPIQLIGGGGQPITPVAAGASIQNIPPVLIAQVTCGGVGYLNRNQRQLLQNGDSYSVTLNQTPAPGAPNGQVIFTGNTNTVVFT